MPSEKLQAIILAAGKATRFKTDKSKLLEKICGQEMILYVTKLLEEINIPTTAVVGFQREALQKTIKKQHNNRINYTLQKEQKGTGHALLCAQPHLTKENILVLNGDMPLISKDIINALYEKHVKTEAKISFVTAHNSDPTAGAYGRVINNNKTIEIIEEKDFTGDIHEHCCINAGIYIIKKQFLDNHINNLTTENKSHEFYITDLVKIASEKGLTVSTLSAPFDKVRGVNTLKELWAAEQVKRAEVVKQWMNKGVRFSLAQSVHIDLNVTIGAGTYIDCNVHLLKGTQVGKNCTINGFSTLSQATVGDNTTIYPHSIIGNSTIGKNAKIGPFACIHEEATIGDDAIIGNFVEVRKSSIGNNSKAKHLTYLANSCIGSNVTIGAGTITCNHDGHQYHRTIIENNVFIGANNSLVAPVDIKEHTATTAGAIICNTPQTTCSICYNPQEESTSNQPKKKKRFCKKNKEHQVSL